MRKKENKIKYPYPYKTEEEARVNESETDFTFIDHDCYTDKGTKITITRKRRHKSFDGKIVYKIIVTEEKYIIDDGKSRTLSDSLELFPINQIKDLGAFRILVNREKDKAYILIPTLGKDHLVLDKKQLKLFEIIYNANGYTETPILRFLSGYKNDNTVRRIIRDLNSKFKGVLKTDHKVIFSTPGVKGYILNEKFRIDQVNKI